MKLAKKFKRSTAVLLACCLILSLGSTAFAAKASDGTVTVTAAVGQKFYDSYGNELGTAYLDSAGRLMVPLRGIALKLNLDVTWDSSTYTATFSGTSTDGTELEVKFTTGSKSYKVTTDSSTVSYTMDTAVAISSEGRIYAPVRYLAEAFGYTVGWDSSTQTATITNTTLPETSVETSGYLLSFEDIESQVKSGSYTYLALEENIASIEAIDYDVLSDTLRDSLSELADGLWLAAVYLNDTYTTDSLQSTYSSLQDTFEELKDGELQADNDDLVRQLRDAQNQIIMGAETLYIAILSLEQSRDDLERSLETLDRTIEEMELRYELGQISALTLAQVKSNRSTITSNLSTLDITIDTYKAQLQTFLGQSPTGDITLLPLPEVSESDLDAMDLDADYAAASEVSWDLYDALITLEDAEETYYEDIKEYHYGAVKDEVYLYEIAIHTYDAAKYTYEATVQSYELSFRQLYNSVQNCRELLAAAEEALEYEEQNLAAVTLKYQLGDASYNDLLDAEDSYYTAQSSVSSAESDLFTAYNNYVWAVNTGIIS